MPTRIVRKRVKGWTMPPNTVSVTRPGKYGNPYTVKPIGMTHWAVFKGDVVVGTRTRSRNIALTQCLDMYRTWALEQIDADPQWLEPLREKSLACFCKEGELCHGNILLELANKELANG